MFISFETSWKTNNLPDGKNKSGKKEIMKQQSLPSHKTKMILSPSKMILFLKLPKIFMMNKIS